MDIRQFFFKNRSYTPIPLVLLLLYFSKPYQPVIYYGFLLLIVGEVFRVWAVSYAGGKTRTTKVGAPKLCTAGPFAYVRNPLYLGNMIIYAGVVLIAGGQYVWLMLGITMLFFIVQYSLIVSLEQRTLTRLFGKEYLVYCEKVPALFPQISPWKDGTAQAPLGFKKVFRPEKNTFFNILLILILIFIRAQIPSV